MESMWWLVSHSLLTANQLLRPSKIRIRTRNNLVDQVSTRRSTISLHLVRRVWFRIRIQGNGWKCSEEFWPAVEKGFRVSLEEGPLAGYPCLDVKLTLMDGAFHAVDSSAIAYELASKAAYRQSMPKAGPQIMEPIMKIDVFTPEDHVGDVIGDLNRRRGMIQGQEAGATGVRVKATAPLSEMFGYIGT